MHSGQAWPFMPSISVMRAYVAVQRTTAARIISQQLTQGTGGVNLWEGEGNPQSTAPFLATFQHAVAETYIATFNAPASNDPQNLVRVKFSAAKTKLHAPEQVRPGNTE